MWDDNKGYEIPKSTGRDSWAGRDSPNEGARGTLLWLGDNRAETWRKCGSESAASQPEGNTSQDWGKEEQKAVSVARQQEEGTGRVTRRSGSSPGQIRRQSKATVRALFLIHLILLFDFLKYYNADLENLLYPDSHILTFTKFNLWKYQSKPSRRKHPIFLDTFLESLSAKNSQINSSNTFRSHP